MMQPYPALLRERVSSVLAGPSRLVVVAGDRFAGKTTLVRGRLAEVEHTGPATYVFVDRPGPESTSEQYWTRVLAEVRDAQGVDAPQTRGDAFEMVCRLPVTADRPLVLVLDGVEQVDGLETGVETLLSRTRSVRVIVTTRRLGAWADIAAGHSDRVILPSSMLAFTPEETSKYLNAHGVPQDLRTVEWIVGRTGGSVTLVDAVRASSSRRSVRICSTVFLPRSSRATRLCALCSVSTAGSPRRVFPRPRPSRARRPTTSKTLPGPTPCCCAPSGFD